MVTTSMRAFTLFLLRKDQRGTEEFGLGIFSPAWPSRWWPAHPRKRIVGVGVNTPLATVGFSSLKLGLPSSSRALYPLGRRHAGPQHVEDVPAESCRSAGAA